MFKNNVITKTKPEHMLSKIQQDYTKKKCPFSLVKMQSGIARREHGTNGSERSFQQSSLDKERPYYVHILKCAEKALRE